METLRTVSIFLLIFLFSCASARMEMGSISDVYVTDFNSDDIDHCRPSDVDLDHADAHEFFKRARQLDSKILHDHYTYAPCHIEGVLKVGSRLCNWVIRAGATGHISCANDIWYFACDACEDLFNHKK